MSQEADHTLDEVADANFGQWLGWRLMDIGDLGAAVRSQFLRRCEGDKEMLDRTLTAADPDGSNNTVIEAIAQSFIEGVLGEKASKLLRVDIELEED